MPPSAAPTGVGRGLLRRRLRLPLSRSRRSDRRGAPGAPVVSLGTALRGLRFTRLGRAPILAGPWIYASSRSSSKVAELGSFSRAAEALFLTQPTVSEHIRASRTSWACACSTVSAGEPRSPGGALLLAYAQRLLALSREARQAMDSFQGRMSGELLVGASTIPGEYILPALIGRFKAKFPDISITLLIGGSQAAVEWVGDGRAEVGVVGARLPHRGVDYRELMADDIVVVVRAAHPWHGRKQIAARGAAERAAPHPRARLGHAGRARAALAEVGMDLGAFRVVGEMGSTQAIKQAVRASVGVSIVSRRAVDEECRAACSGVCASKDLTIARSFYLATHRERSRSPLAEAFRAFVEAEAT